MIGDARSQKPAPQSLIWSDLDAGMIGMELKGKT